MHKRVPCFRYVGETADALDDRIYQHVQGGIASNNSCNTLLDIALACTVADDWEVYAWDIPNNINNAVVQHLGILTFRSYYPYGLNVQ